MAAKNVKHILVIEDDAELANSVVVALEKAGFSALAANEMREAIFKIKNAKYACILLDMRLGQDSGEELVDFIRERRDAQNLDTPILVISGHLDRELVARLAGKIQGALVKPFDVDALLTAVKKVT